jgi:hypothetical protein
VFVVDGQNERRLRRGRAHQASYHGRQGGASASHEGISTRLSLANGIGPC